ARQVAALVRSRATPGVYHATSSGEATCFEVAREVFLMLGADPARVRVTSSSAYVRPTPRPSYSVLGHDAWAAVGVEPIGDWRLALRQALPALTAAELSGAT
ncbi:MAG TPA: sugar nucleotide-binding protein, partial [Streptosporangiaceae bacterium]|nr:sugar nucleotide-binding protein [Streptosporangiaceae bacterium]